MHCCLVLELDCLYNNTSFCLSLSTCEITYYLSTLSKWVSPLITLSFNHPKPTKGLDALSPPHASGHRQCCGCQLLPYRTNMVKTPCLPQVSTVWRVLTSAMPEQDDITSHVHPTSNSVVSAYHHLATRLRSIRTLSLSFVRPSPSSIKGDALSPNIQVIPDS